MPFERNRGVRPQHEIHEEPRANRMDRRAARWFAVALFVVTILVGPQVTVHAQQAVNSAERLLFDAANRERIAQGLQPLRWDAALANAAREHAMRMAQRRRDAAAGSRATGWRALHRDRGECRGRPERGNDSLQLDAFASSLSKPARSRAHGNRNFRGLIHGSKVRTRGNAVRGAGFFTIRRQSELQAAGATSGGATRLPRLAGPRAS